MKGSPNRTRLIAALAAAALLVTGCMDVEAVSSGTNKKSNAGNCRKAGALTVGVLPTVRDATTVENPCLGVAKLVAKVVGALSPADEGRLKKNGFLRGVTKFAGRLDKLTDVQECAYRTDRLAVRFYQHRRPRWSIGAVVVVRGGADAVVDTARCVLLKQFELPFGRSGGQGLVAADAPADRPCFNMLRTTRDGRGYTVMWVGSSTRMCDAIADHYGADASDRTTVNADVVAVRSGPYRSSTRLGTAPFGSVATVLCHTAGGTVSTDRTTSDRWVKAKVNGVTGYLWEPYLDNAGDAGTCSDVPEEPGQPDEPPAEEPPVEEPPAEEPPSEEPTPTEPTTDDPSSGTG
ncbi:SH3 domain-containing protein [Sinosporangium siamense]|uniref:SH3b domain-containing protein n=1 Tax=Sinosporangium siamense TaxID=1367973 RepID=A0A919VA51_9ACTN|nr:SH3 domain-containing protein [Sinosporangium siamense]GII96061.1 hypothetical protein Ssi02_62920 [Sinosporangium siamense]